MSDKPEILAANDPQTETKKTNLTIVGESREVSGTQEKVVDRTDLEPKRSRFSLIGRKILAGIGSKHIVLPNQDLSLRQLEALPPTEGGKLLDMPSDVKPGIIGRIQNVKNKVRYGRWNPFSRWNKKIDQWTKEESWERQREIHIQRWDGIFFMYKALFKRVLALFFRPKDSAPRYASFEDMLFEQNINENDLKKLIKMRKRQIAIFYFFMAVPFLSACFFIYHKLVWMFVLNMWVFIMLGVINLLFVIELWRLQNRRLGGFKQWLQAK